MVRFFSYFFAVMALLTLPLKSYGQDNKTVYSCDPEINEWVKANLDKIHKMSRTEWLLLDEMKGRAVFAAFTPQQQQDFANKNQRGTCVRLENRGTHSHTEAWQLL